MINLSAFHQMILTVLLTRKVTVSKSLTLNYGLVEIEQLRAFLDSAVANLV